MTRITEKLVRSKAEHNEGIIHTLEELTLHQLDIEKIENLHRWCPKLQILMFQGNLISKLENLYRLKELNYLNMAMNCVEVIDDITSCEYLAKLDLTLNFVRVISNFNQNMGECAHLRDLILTGNPCCEFPNYRDYVIASLPQITRLDNTEISQTERIQAIQSFEKNKKAILLAEDEALAKRHEQKRAYAEKLANRGPIDLDLDPENDPFWQEKEDYTPESKKNTAEYMRLKDQKKDNHKPKIQEPKREKRNIRLVDKDGDALNVNEPKIHFVQDEDERFIKITVFTWKSLETEDLDVDLKEKSVKILIKGKVLQLVFWEDIIVEQSKCERAKATGHLTLVLQKKKYNPKVRVVKKVENKRESTRFDEADDFDDMPELV